MKRRFRWIFGILILAAILLGRTASAVVPDKEPVPPEPFAVQAGSYILMEMQTERVLAGRDIHERRAMASTTKIMTALLTLEQPDLDAYFTVDSKAILVEGSSPAIRSPFGDLQWECFCIPATTAPARRL